MEESIFNKLNAINVNGKTEEKNGLTYLSWAFAWGELKKLYPDANYVIYENTLPNGYIVNYFTDGKTAWVKTGVIVNGLEHIEMLPVMDYKNKSIPLDALTSFDVNKTIQRSLTKAVARHGLGLYIYAGEDLPEDEDKESYKPTYSTKPASKIVDGKETLPQPKSKDEAWERAEYSSIITKYNAYRKVCEKEGVTSLKILDTETLKKYADLLKNKYESV